MASGATGRARSAPRATWSPTCWPGWMSTRRWPTRAFADAYAQWLVEKFLIAADDGWILRKAQYYRGAVQEEDERETARRLLIGMAGQPAWIGHRFVALRTGARLLPHGADGASAQKVRNLAAALNDRDAGFEKLRIKIHNSPEATDAEAVRAWAASAKDPKLAEQARELAAEIDRVYAPRPFTQVLDAAAKELAADAALKPVLQEARTAFAAAGGCRAAPDGVGSAAAAAARCPAAGRRGPAPTGRAGPVAGRRGRALPRRGRAAQRRRQGRQDQPRRHDRAAEGRRRCRLWQRPDRRTRARRARQGLGPLLG